MAEQCGSDKTKMMSMMMMMMMMMMKMKTMKVNEGKKKQTAGLMPLNLDCHA
jgi:hypothetical protein